MDSLAQSFSTPSKAPNNGVDKLTGLQHFLQFTARVGTLCFGIAT